MLSIKEINLLQAQNEGLKKQNAELQKENTELKAENERLKENIEDLSKDLQVQNKILGKFDTTLQQIKAIAEENQFYFGEATIVSYKTIKQIATSFEKILDLITKAESEG